MNTMSDYTVYCTEEQTKRAYKLGAPIKKDYSVHFGVKSVHISPEHEGSFYATIPTTQQMIGWLREKGLIVFVTYVDIYESHVYDKGCTMISSKRYFESFQEAEFAAIDAALDYLMKGE